MAKWQRVAVMLCLIVASAMVPLDAYAAYQELRCSGGVPDAGTSLYDDSTDGACKYTGVQYIFSTVVCQFVTMVNIIMGKLYCSIQMAVEPVVMAVMTLFVILYGAQVLMGTAQLKPGEFITRVIKMTLVLWLVTDPSFGVSAGISYMFNFFMSFMGDSTRWVVKVLDSGAGMNVYSGGYGDYTGVSSTFYFLDTWIYNSLTGSLSDANARVIGFFVAMAIIMPSITVMAVYWWFSMVMMMMRTLLAFLMAIVSVSFLLGLSPIFLSFMLFQVTFQYFDQWLRFMMSFCLQVMVSFAIMTMWIFSLSLFAPFFNELSAVIYPYQKIIRPAAAIYTPADTLGICPLVVYANPYPKVRCIKSNFNPVGPQTCGPSNPVKPCYDGEGVEIDPKEDIGTTKPNKDYEDIIPPAKITELPNFIFYLFYNLASLVIVTYGFASLQKNASSISRQLAGPSYTPILNGSNMTTTFSDLNQGKATADRFMSTELFSGFGRRHNASTSPYQAMMAGARNMVTKR